MLTLPEYVAAHYDAPLPATLAEVRSPARKARRACRGAKNSPKVVRTALHRHDGTVRPVRTSADVARILRRLASRPARSYRRALAVGPVDPIAHLPAIGMLAERRAVRALAGAPLAFDAVGDALSRLWQRCAKGEAPTHPVAYVARIAVRESTRRERRAEERLALRTAEAEARTYLDVATVVERIEHAHAHAVAVLSAPASNDRAVRAARADATAILTAAIGAESVTVANS